ncbi:MAG: hypothetical protein A3F10_00345 [Coxiella sp. RIFCSPHIGHO2_12_FULL_42_15]|nr:MAG: hypothetical protein A3F10_00345 [Coxiella sp. RIFCSPHIGHO2_12_FULL_42_15]
MKQEYLIQQHYSLDFFESIQYFRKIALEIDRNPASITNHLNFLRIKQLCHDRNSTCLERVQRIEALSYGDSGVVLACPGPSLSGLLLRELGSEEQKERFFQFIESHAVTTFLAVSEPNKGSDAGQMETTLKSQGAHTYVLQGEKWLVGHGADAPIGVVVARRSTGPLGIIAILITPEEMSASTVHLERTHLKMFGLCGARLSHLKFNDFSIPKENILGAHLKSTERGMMAVMKTFNRMRPVVAALALGQAQAIIDYLQTNFYFNKTKFKFLQILNSEILSTRRFLYHAAKCIDQDPMNSFPASAAKSKSTALVEKILSVALDFVDVEWVEHPFLLKWHRDVYGYEYMEGTSHIQLKQVYQSYRQLRKK